MPGSAEVFLLAGLVLVVASGGASAAVAWFLSFVVGDVLRVRRGHAEAAMARAGISDPPRVASGMYRSLARGLAELVGMVFTGTERRISVGFPWTEIERLRAAHRRAVIATGHTGNWDLVACAVAARMPLTVVTKRLSVRLLDALWQRARSLRGVRLAEVGQAAQAAARALQRGEFVAMLVDQAPERERGAVKLQFLGAPAWVDLAPALCALRARAALIVAFPLRLEDGSHTVEIAGVLTPPPRATRAWAVESMAEVTRLLEVFVRKHPEQWLWMHRRWKPGKQAGQAALPHAKRDGVLGEMS